MKLNSEYVNLNRNQFLMAVASAKELFAGACKGYPELGLYPVFSRFGPRSGQCDLTTALRKILLDFPEMLVASDDTKRLRGLLCDLKKAEGDKENDQVSKLRKQSDALEAKLLVPELLLYCGDVLIEFRPGNLKYESLRRLQQDPRLPDGLNEVGNIRVIAGALSSFIK